MGHIEQNLSRRQFVVAGLSAAGGLMLGVSFPSLAGAMPLSTAPWSNDAVAANEINAWIVIDPDETITIRIPHAEMGQGAGTANPMLVAEELECDWAKIKGEFASPNRNVRENNVYKDQNTVGSRGVATSWQYLQQAGERVEDEGAVEGYAIDWREEERDRHKRNEDDGQVGNHTSRPLTGEDAHHQQRQRADCEDCLLYTSPSPRD